MVTDNHDPEEFVTIDEIRQRLKVVATTVHRWVHDGKLPSYKIGGTLTRYKWGEVLALMRRKNGKDEGK